MRLADFIDANVESIVQAAVTFAQSLLPAAAHLDQAELCDHLPLVLQTVSDDLRTSQTSAQALSKSLGVAPHIFGQQQTAAESHAIVRAKDGFQIGQLVGEYRALRASVLRLWTAASEPFDAEEIGDMVRFNEAIDQAVSESVAFFAVEVDRWRHVFLGVLGHDLRNPLNAILMTSQLLSRTPTDAPITQQVERLILGGERMSSLLDDLLDFSRASLGFGIGLNRSAIDLAVACGEEIDVLRAALLRRDIRYLVEGNAQGSFDGSRVREALSNLVVNAAKYGLADGPILVRLVGTEAMVELLVENDGVPISNQELSLLFEPLRRGADQTPSQAADRSSLGLGLFIVRQVARAHGGEAYAKSEDGKTTFTIKLKR